MRGRVRVRCDRERERERETKMGKRLPTNGTYEHGDVSASDEVAFLAGHEYSSTDFGVRFDLSQHTVEACHHVT